jgi:hypothetical protein
LDLVSLTSDDYGVDPAILFPFFGRLRPPKADAFSTSVILDEFNPSAFKRAAEGSFIRKGNWNLPVDDLGPAYRGYAHLRGTG